jgi:hypothetical protein
MKGKVISFIRFANKCPGTEGLCPPFGVQNRARRLKRNWQNEKWFALNMTYYWSQKALSTELCENPQFQ